MVYHSEGEVSELQQDNTCGYLPGPISILYAEPRDCIQLRLLDGYLVS